MAGTNVCVGGGQHAASSYATSAQAYVTAFGYTYNSSDPFASIYMLVLSQFRPVGQAAGGAWDALSEACMRTRNLLFCNNTPDDCGSSFAASSALGTLRLGSGIGLSGASAGIGIANAAGAGISSIAGAAIPAVGAILSAVLSVYQKHVAAEAAQEGQLCTECPAATSIMKQIDAAVVSGSATGEQAYSAMENLSTQFIGALSGIFKSGNAADGYERIMKCQVALSLYLYGISPLPPNLSSGAVAGDEGSATTYSSNLAFSGGTSEDEESGTMEVVSSAIPVSSASAIVPAVVPAAATTSAFSGGILAILLILV